MYYLPITNSRGKKGKIKKSALDNNNDIDLKALINWGM